MVKRDFNTSIANIKIRLFFCLEYHKKRVNYLIDLLVFVSLLANQLDNICTVDLFLVLSLFIYFLVLLIPKITISLSFL